VSHHVEVFFDDNGDWGWQCFEPNCDAVDGGFTDISAAESSADKHIEEA
jgi:hypothetical protein